MAFFFYILFSIGFYYSHYYNTSPFRRTNRRYTRGPVYADIFPMRDARRTRRAGKARFGSWRPCWNFFPPRNQPATVGARRKEKRTRGNGPRDADAVAVAAVTFAGRRGPGDGQFVTRCPVARWIFSFFVLLVCRRETSRRTYRVGRDFSNILRFFFSFSFHRFTPGTVLIVFALSANRPIVRLRRGQ